MRMKKLLLVVLVILVAFACAACANSKAQTRKGVCSGCGQETTLHRYVLKGELGNAANRGDIEYLCDYCIRISEFAGY